MWNTVSFSTKVRYPFGSHPTGSVLRRAKEAEEQLQHLGRQGLETRRLGMALSSGAGKEKGPKHAIVCGLPQSKCWDKV